MKRVIVVTFICVAACGVAHEEGDGGAPSHPDAHRDDANAPVCARSSDCSRPLVCAGTDGSGFHCVPQCHGDQTCPAGMYCIGGGCAPACTLTDLSSCLPGAVCVGGECRNAIAWSNDCTGHDACPTTMGCHFLIGGLTACETLERAYCDGACPAEDPDWVCVHGYCESRR